MESITNLVRPNILAVRPYSSARDEFKGSASVWLDANENSLGSPVETDYSRYPDPLQKPLRTALANLKAVAPAQIFIGNGSDEAIDLLLRAFCEPGKDNIILMPPTYGMYAVQAAIHGVAIRAAPLRPDFSPDAGAVLRLADAQSKLLFICSPNNPTGQCLPDSFIIDMLAQFPGIVVVDEAYIDFAQHNSWLQRLADYPNLVVLQTLSKAWGLAALRIGMAYSNEFIISILNKIKYPYNLNAVTIQLATEALHNQAVVQAKITVLQHERERLKYALADIACVQHVFPSDANFLLVRVTDANLVYRNLCARGIVVRNRTNELHCDNCLRITVGAPAENDLLLAALSAY